MVAVAPLAETPAARAWTAGGPALKRALLAGIRRVLARRDALNRMNVFPVPDGDTGSNLAFTLAHVEQAVLPLRRSAAGALLQHAGNEAIDGARGNSGAILAQFLQGVGERLAALPRLDPGALAAAVLAPGVPQLVPTGLAIELPPGYEAQIRPRSGLALKHGVTLVNTPGTIDADYRGEIRVILINHGTEPFVVRRGDRIAQMIVAPVCRVRWDLQPGLPATERGDGGFGHTG